MGGLSRFIATTSPEMASLQYEYRLSRARDIVTDLISQTPPLNKVDRVMLADLLRGK